MELTLVLSAVIFTLLAVAVATLVLRGSWSAGESPNPPRPSAAGAAGASAPAAGLEPPGPGHKAPDHRRDAVNHHWDVRKCVASVSPTKVWLCFLLFFLFHYVIIS